MIVRSIPDMGTQQAELMSGGIHWMYNVKKDVGESMAIDSPTSFFTLYIQ